MRVCAENGCPQLTTTTRCPTHTRTHDQARGSRQTRGYDNTHVQLRARWAPQVATGTIHCWRCRELITPDEPWDLGHDDHNRAITRGPEHANRCNRAAAGRKSHT